MKTNELTGAALDWAVAKCEGEFTLAWFWDDCSGAEYMPSTNWQMGGAIIEREGIALYLYGDSAWNAMKEKEYKGKTPLIAAMRCYVASMLGDEVEVPDDLLSCAHE